MTNFGKSEEEEDRWLLSISSSFLFFRFHARFHTWGGGIRFLFLIFRDAIHDLGFFFFPFLLKRNELKNDPFRWRFSVNITPVSFDRGLNPVSITLDDRARLLAKKNLIWRKEIFNQDIPFFFLNYSYYSSGFTRNNKYFLYFVCYKIMNIWFIYIYVCVYTLDCITPSYQF